jgi:hypothetical protein
MATNERTRDTRRDIPDILARIEVYKRAEIEAAKAQIPLDEIQRLADQALPPRGFAAAIDAHLAQGRPALIAEIKMASPSKMTGPSGLRSSFPRQGLCRGWRELPVRAHGPTLFPGTPGLSEAGTTGIWYPCRAQGLPL